MRLRSFLNEVSTTATEDLHECFFAISFAGLIANIKGFSTLKKFEDMKLFVIRCGNTLKEAEKTLETVERHTSSSKKFEKFVIERLKDANSAAIKSYDEIKNGYKISDNEFISVERVFASGKKELADSKVVVNIRSGGKDIISVSLKYGKGQFGSLSPKIILKMLYDIDMKDSGVLKELYKTPKGMEAINKSLNIFIETINNNLDVKNKIEHSITYEEYNSSKYNATRKEYANLYSSVPKKLTVEYENSKKQISLALVELIDSRKSLMVSNENIVEFLKHFLRAEKDKSYIYVASGGKTIYFIPSEDALSQHDLSVEVLNFDKDKTDFRQNIAIKINNQTIIEFGFKFRWKSGQFLGDWTALGTHIKINKDFKW